MLRQVFQSDRQKGQPCHIEGGAGAGTGTIMTRIITERTSHLAPGAPFMGGTYLLVEGLRTSNTSIVR